MTRFLSLPCTFLLILTFSVFGADGPWYCAHCYVCNIQDSGYPYTWECDGTYSKQAYIGIDCCGNFTLVIRPGGAWDYDPLSCSKAFAQMIMISCSPYHPGCSQCAEAETYYTLNCGCELATCT